MIIYRSRRSTIGSIVNEPGLWRRLRRDLRGIDLDGVLLCVRYSGMLRIVHGLGCIRIGVNSFDRSRVLHGWCGLLGCWMRVSVLLLGVIRSVLVLVRSSRLLFSSSVFLVILLVFLYLSSSMMLLHMRGGIGLLRRIPVTLSHRLTTVARSGIRVLVDRGRGRRSPGIS